MMTLKVLYTLCLLSCSVLPVTCWCPQSVSHLSLSAVYSPWSTQQPEWPLKNVYQSRFPCCWESSGDLPSVLEWGAQVLLQLSGSVAFISLFAEPWSCASASSSLSSGHVDIKPGKLIPNTESLQRLFPMAGVPFPVLIQPPPVFPRKPPGSTSLSLL